MFAVVLGLGGTLWLHWIQLAGSGESMISHLPSIGIDAALGIPAAGLAIWLVAAFGTIRSELARGISIGMALAVMYVPLSILSALGHLTLGTAPSQHHSATAVPGTFTGLLGYGMREALQVEPVLLLLAICGTALTGVGLSGLWRHGLTPRLRPLGAGGSAIVVVAGMLTSAMVTPAPAVAQTVAELGGGCGTAPSRTYDVVALNVDIVVNRFGDHDPYGFMYALADKEDDVRAAEAALIAASSLPIDDPAAAKVSAGLAQDVIQPLVLRARLGECVAINLTNKLTAAPRSGPNGNPAITQPGGVPSVSIDMSGVAYDAAAGDGGQAVGTNPHATMTAPGATRQYKFFLDPVMGEGAKVFRSGGDSFQLTSHGLFGALVAEPAGASWYDPATGHDVTGYSTWSNWEAMIRPASGPAFREFTIIYHEIGDENFNLRRPLRENAEGAPVGDQVTLGRPLPMIDTGALNPTTPTAGGGGTNAYRPSSRALNYRAESFFRRLQLMAARGLDAVRANESLTYSSYAFGDPPTPMPRSYLGEPTKTRLVHAGFEQLHVHHLHGGGTRWRLNPGADDTEIDGGLQKVPLQNASSIRLDSQTISPTETFTLEHECGAGGCQQAVGDFLYHCHIAHHYIAGMWGMWRVFNTAQMGLAPLPTKMAPPAGVTSAGLLGRTLSDGKTVVLQANYTNPSTQVPLESLVEGQLPPQGARFDPGTGPDPDDATVWDWNKGGTATAPVYQGEPETTTIWANYRSPTPGVRPDILFNPVNGRPAYPMFKPHFALRPPFSPNGHSGAPYLGNTVATGRPDGLCPTAAPVRKYDVTAIAIAIQETARERDANGEIFVLNEDKAAVLAGTKPTEPLVIRSNVGDCVAITFGSELNAAVQHKVNMHTHFVQFDPQASDGVITGFAYEQSIFNAAKDARTIVSVQSSTKVTVSNVTKLRVGISIGIGVGRANIEIRKITAISGNQLTFDSALTNTHAAGEPVTVEFVQYRWYSDVDSGTVFWHDHVNGIDSWAHGLFAAHIIEPKNSTYRDPLTGNPVKSGTIVDIVNTSGSVGAGQSGSFREFMIFLHNGRRGRNELTAASGGGLNPFNFGQECEEGTINLRAAPVGERTPPGATPADPATTMQRQEYNGVRCRNAFSRTGDVATDANANTQRATITTVDPYVFSSVKYGDPTTPLLRAYVGDPVVIRTIGLAERAEALRLQGHRFRVERFNADGQFTDTATTGISERFDYVLDGGAGGPGDYMYYSTRSFAFESGAWGIFRVHDKLQSNLKVLPGRTAPASGSGFPKQTAATGNTQQTPGPNPASAYNANGTVNTTVVTSTTDPCPGGARAMNYDISLINKALPTAPFSDASGVVYALTSDVAAINAGTKPVEPLVLRANKGDCVSITLRNQTTAGSLFGGTRAGFDLGRLKANRQLASGSAVGLNPDTTVAAGGSLTYKFYADSELGTTLFQNLGSVGSLRHGAYGMLIVEPQNSTWFDSLTNMALSSTRTSTQAIIRGPAGFTPYREFTLTMQTTDQQYARSIVPYIDMVAGNGLNSLTGANIPAAPVPGAPPGTAANAGSLDKAYNHLNYRSEPLTQRLGLTANPADYTTVTPIGGYHLAFSSTQFGDPDTPVFRAHPGDKVVFRLGVGASDQFHSFTVSGHVFPLEPKMWGSQLMAARTVTAGETLDAWLAGGAGGSERFRGDYLYGDAKQPFQEAGMWGIFRVEPSGSTLPWL
ncbi:hypothetical protein Rhe02_49760 [Rhizocola hellebori]|uniref:Plastocyanin-like domain-containing protein n=1 Tax=Rhizocola hellebori TaxID=1392758 RepID=A0A8J3VH04_9ACTN|nr:hypothetical protein Rhe02_49760 [Rhizocola hellebori]